MGFEFSLTTPPTTTTALTKTIFTIYAVFVLFVQVQQIESLEQPHRSLLVLSPLTSSSSSSPFSISSVHLHRVHRRRQVPNEVLKTFEQTTTNQHSATQPQQQTNSQIVKRAWGDNLTAMLNEYDVVNDGVSATSIDENDDILLGLDRFSTFSPKDSIEQENLPSVESSLAALTTNELIFRLIGSLFGLILLAITIAGNVLVIVVVCKFHRMRSVTNILLASLAIADITVACLVMPFTVVHDLLRFWPWNQILCHFWISCDVMCCTASILHLCAVAIDRFWAITRPLRYRSLISKRRLFCCIVLIWFCSAAISFIPIFTGYYHAEAPINVFKLRYSPECGLNVNRIYATISSLTSFYMPLPIMFYVYFRILLVAERQSREIKQLEESLARNGFLTMNCTIQQNVPKKISTSSATPQAAHLQHSIQFNSLINIETGETGQLNDVAGSNMDVLSVGSSDPNHALDSKRHAERSLRRRTKQLITDTKAIRTLGIVMGVFCLCWLPFFIMYLISAFCDKCDISYETRSGITWLGYINSALNPAIYAYLNKEFRAAFQRVICCLPGSAWNPDQNERDAMIEEVSTTSRSCQRTHQTLDRFNNSLDVPLTPGFMSRTPSATPDPSNWPVLQCHTLVVPDKHSHKTSITDKNFEETNGNRNSKKKKKKINNGDF